MVNQKQCHCRCIACEHRDCGRCVERDRSFELFPHVAALLGHPAGRQGCHRQNALTHLRQHSVVYPCALLHRQHMHTRSSATATGHQQPHQLRLPQLRCEQQGSLDRFAGCFLSVCVVPSASRERWSPYFVSPFSTSSNPVKLPSHSTPSSRHRCPHRHRDRSVCRGGGVYLRCAAGTLSRSSFCFLTTLIRTFSWHPLVIVAHLFSPFCVHILTGYPNETCSAATAPSVH